MPPGREGIVRECLLHDICVFASVRTCRPLLMGSLLQYLVYTDKSEVTTVVPPSPAATITVRSRPPLITQPPTQTSPPSAFRLKDGWEGGKTERCVHELRAWRVSGCASYTCSWL